MNIDTKILSAGTGCSPTVAALWVDAMNAAMTKFKINVAPEGIAAFLANVGEESGSLTVFVENLNYSAQALARVWPNRYAVDPKAAVKVPNALANSLARKPVAIANNCYANRMGNGSEASGDGWKYRGQGPIQLTGKAQIEMCQAATGLALDTNPEQLSQPVPGSLSAAWYFANSGALAAALKGDFDQSVKRVNGALPCPANNGPRRRALYAAALELMNA